MAVSGNNSVEQRQEALAILDWLGQKVGGDFNQLPLVTKGHFGLDKNQGNLLEGLRRLRNRLVGGNGSFPEVGNCIVNETIFALLAMQQGETVAAGYQLVWYHALAFFPRQRTIFEVEIQRPDDKEYYGPMLDKEKYLYGNSMLSAASLLLFAAKNSLSDRGWQGAMARLNLAEALNPFHPYIYVLKGDIYTRLRQETEALQQQRYAEAVSNLIEQEAEVLN
jgi:hypothetical protein